MPLPGLDEEHPIVFKRVDVVVGRAPTLRIKRWHCQLADIDRG